MTAGVTAAARLVGAVGALGAAPLALVAWVRLSTRSGVIGDLGAVGHHHAALVLGCGVLRDGRPSLMLVQRVEAACALLAAGAVDTLLLSGDGNGSRGHDEVAVMHRLALERGAPETALLGDRDGVSTSASCRRAVQVFGLHDAVVVTQRFHAGRAAFLARRAGLGGVALALPDRAVYGWRVVAPLELRELAATLKAALSPL